MVDPRDKGRREFLDSLLKAAVAGTAATMTGSAISAQIASPRNVRVTAGARSILTPPEIAWRGQAKIPPSGSTSTPAGGTNYMGPAMAVRYLSNGTRVLLTVNFTTAPVTGWCSAGSLVEWQFPTMYQGPVSGAPNMVATGRTWADWFDADALAIGNPSTGVRMGGLWWDDSLQVLWYCAYAYYAGSNRPFLGATRLHDDGTVTRYGMWYYRSGDVSAGNSVTYWKGAGGWVVGIPGYAQTDVGVMGVGAPPLGTIGGYGHMGPGLHTLPAKPALSDAPGGVIPVGTRVLDYSTEYQAPSAIQNCRRKNTNYVPLGSLHNPGYWLIHDGSTFSSPGAKGAWPSSGLALPTAVGSAVYVGLPTGDRAVNLYLEMTTPAVGGARVWEYSRSDGSWGALSPTFNVGTASLAGPRNNGAWLNPPGDFAPLSVNGTTTRWIRIRNTATLSVGGAIAKSGSTNFCDPTPANPPVSSGMGYWQFSRENVETFVWAYTDTKHGVLCFGRQPQGYTWYGVSRGFGGDGTVWAEDLRTVALDGYGYHTDNDTPCLYVFDPNDLIDAARNVKRGNASEVNPVAEYDWHAAWPNIPDTVGDQGWIASYAGNGGFWDSRAKQLVWLHPLSVRTGYSDTPSVQVFDIA